MQRLLAQVGLAAAVLWTVSMLGCVSTDEGDSGELCVVDTHLCAADGSVMRCEKDGSLSLVETCADPFVCANGGCELEGNGLENWGQCADPDAVQKEAGCACSKASECTSGVCLAYNDSVSFCRKKWSFSADQDKLGDEAAYLFDQAKVRTYELTIDAEKWEWLRANAKQEDYVRASLSFDGQVLDDVGVRFKGRSTLLKCVNEAGALTCPTASMKIKFSEYEKKQRFFGLKRLNFHAMTLDDTLLRERIGYQLYREMGVPAPRAVHAKLVINGELFGLFALVEMIDSQFVRSRMPDGGEGNLYEEILPLSQAPEVYKGALKTNEDDNPSVAAMLGMAADIKASTPDTVEQVFEKWMDPELVVRQMVASQAISHYDSLPSSDLNFYMYESIDNQQLWFIPWDMDNAFHLNPQPEFVLSLAKENPVIHALLNHSGFQKAAQAFAAEKYELDRIKSLIDTYSEQLMSGVEADPNKSVEGWKERLKHLRNVEMPAVHKAFTSLLK